MIFYILLIASAITFVLAFTNSCKILAILREIEEANEVGTVPDRDLIMEMDKSFTILSYLLVACITILIFFKILYERSHQ